MAATNKYEQYAKSATVKPKKIDRSDGRYNPENVKLEPGTTGATVGGVWRGTPEQVAEALMALDQSMYNASAQKLQDLQRARASAMAGDPYRALGQSGGYVGGTWHQAPAQIPFWGGDNYGGTGTELREGPVDASFNAAVQKAGGPQYAPNDPRGPLEETPSGPGDKKGPWQTGQFKSYDKPLSPFDKKVELIRTSITEQADQRIDDIRSLLGMGLEDLSQQEKALIAGTASTAEWRSDLAEINRAERLDDKELIEGGYEQDVEASNARLAGLGIKNPTVFTDKPKNSTEAHLQGVYRAADATLTELDATSTWFGEKLDNINRTGLSRERSALLLETAQMISEVEGALTQGLLELDILVLEKEISEQEAAADGAQRVMAAQRIADELGVRADTVMAMWDADILKTYAGNVWEPDEDYWPVGGFLDGEWGDATLPLDEIIKILNIFQKKQEIEHQSTEFQAQYGG